MLAPEGAVADAFSTWFVSVTFFNVRVVVTRPGIGDALMLGRLRWTRLSGSVAEATYCAAVTSNVTVGATARLARIEPAPRSNGSDGVTPFSLSTSWRDDVISADLIWPGVQSGCESLTSAEMPALCGLDIDVPAMAWKNWPGGPTAKFVSYGSGVVPARIWIPGAVTSGLMKSPSGPRDENDVMTSPRTVVGTPVVNVAVSPAWAVEERDQRVRARSRVLDVQRRHPVVVGVQTEVGQAVVEDHSGRAAERCVVALERACPDLTPADDDLPGKRAGREVHRPGRLRRGLAQVVRLARDVARPHHRGRGGETPAVMVAPEAVKVSPLRRPERERADEVPVRGGRSDRVRPRACVIRGRRPGPGVTGRGVDQDACLVRVEEGELDGIGVRARPARDREVEHVGAVEDRLIHGRDGVGSEAARMPGRRGT